MTKAFCSNNDFSAQFLTAELNSAVQNQLNMHVLISITDVNGVILYANEKFCAVSGYNQNELIGKNHNIVNSGHHDKAFIADVWDTISNGKTWHGQFCNRKKNGELYWVDSTIAPLLDVKNRPYQYLSIRCDITEQKNSELKLLTLKQGLEASNEMVLISNAQGFVEYTNPAFHRLSGWTAEQTIGHAPSFLDSENVNQEVLAEMCQTLKQGKSWSGRLLNRRQIVEHNQNVEIKTVDYWAAVNITPILKSNGEISGYVQIQRDCSVNVAREESLRCENADKAARLAIAQALQQPEPLKKRFTQVLKLLFELEAFNLQRKGGIFLKSTDEKFLNLFVLHGHFSDDFFKREQSIALGVGICGKAATITEITVANECFCEARYVEEFAENDIHGHYIVPLTCAEKILGVLFLYTDKHPIQNSARLGMLKQVGEMMALALLQKQAQLALSQSRDAAIKMAEMKSEFLANMSHEIRTPMNGILGMLDLLSDTRLTSEQADLVHTAANSAESLLTILNDILDFSKLEAHKLTLESIEFHLPALVEDVGTLLSSHASDRQIELTCFLPANLPILWLGDPTRLRQILTNLVGNALKFTQQGEVNVRVMQTTSADGQTHCRFEVQDSGIGISPEQQLQLFKPFTQADSSTTRKFGGTGLGLSICKSLVEMMGGAIGVESVVGQGATFWFDLPLSPALQQPPGLPNYFSGTRVLLIEANATNREIFTHHLQAWQCSVQTENSGNAGLLELEIAALSDTPYDVAIIDLHLPDMDGRDVARAMSANPLLSHTPRLLLSASGFIGETEQHSLGFSYCLFKPIRTEQLFNALWNTLTNAPQILTTIRSEISYEDFRDKHILVVEDNAINQKVIIAALARFNITPDVVENGAQALERLKNTCYDLILMDCQMPVMDGYETTRQLRAQENERFCDNAIPVIALTAHNSNLEREKCLAAGMNDYLSKPFNRHTFNKMLTTWLKSTLTEPLQSQPETSKQSGATLIWNEAATIAQLDGDKELLAEMIALFLEQVPELLETLNTLLQNDDFAVLADSAHSLKGMVNHFYAKALAVKIGILENAARENKIADFEAMINDISSATMQLIDVLTHYKNRENTL